jgi:hypothetical protein
LDARRIDYLGRARLDQTAVGPMIHVADLEGGASAGRAQTRGSSRSLIQF